MQKLLGVTDRRMHFGGTSLWVWPGREERFEELKQEQAEEQERAREEGSIGGEVPL